MNKIILLYVSLIISYFSFSQNKYEIGVEGGVTFDTYKIEDAGDKVTTVPCVSGMGGINFRINTKKKFYYEIAFIAKSYADGIKFKKDEGHSISDADAVILIPLRLGYAIKLSNRFSLAPVAGVTAGVKTKNSYENRQVIEIYNGDLSGIGYEVRDINRNFLALLQGGVAIGYVGFKQKVRLSLEFNFYHGLSTINIYDIEYRMKNSPAQKATMYSKGSFTNLNLGIRYLLKRRV